jgi:hypothetical protein
LLVLYLSNHAKGCTQLLFIHPCKFAWLLGLLWWPAGCAHQSNSMTVHPLSFSDAQLAISLPQHTKKTFDFVQFNVIDVANPGLVEIAFKVYYHSNQKPRTLIGAFALYPPNQPGQFLIRLPRSLDYSGALWLELETPASTVKKGETSVSVTIETPLFVQTPSVITQP